MATQAPDPYDSKMTFVDAWSALVGDDFPEPEHHFHDTRLWRFDWAWPKWKVAVEVDGGQMSPYGGRHASDADREKLNAAAELGWLVFRFSVKMIAKDPFEVVRQVEGGLRCHGRS